MLNTYTEIFRWSSFQARSKSFGCFTAKEQGVFGALYGALETKKGLAPLFCTTEHLRLPHVTCWHPLDQLRYQM